MHDSERVGKVSSTMVNIPCAVRLHDTAFAEPHLTAGDVSHVFLFRCLGMGKTTIRWYSMNVIPNHMLVFHFLQLCALVIP